MGGSAIRGLRQQSPHCVHVEPFKQQVLETAQEADFTRVGQRDAQGPGSADPSARDRSPAAAAPEIVVMAKWPH